jgi:hypothetical protein
LAHSADRLLVEIAAALMWECLLKNSGYDINEKTKNKEPLPENSCPLSIAPDFPW